MAKALCIFGMVVAVLVLLVFGLDIGMGFPFGKINQIMDIVMIVCAAILGYISWSTLKEEQQ